MPARKKPLDSSVAVAPPRPSKAPPATKGAIYLIDAMSFIFRAYHAMARQRPMSTKTGLPTAATFVFVNMLRKLRDDFSPEFMAAVFDVAAPTFRVAQAGTLTTVRKFNIKTQTFQEIQYGGYKANRTEMPGDLAQQIPYIRRAIEAYRIPILQFGGYEADDLIGTLARQASEQSFPVYVVSSDKDMLQLVDDKVLVLNPPKDNLIADAAKVEEILGVPPERVIDVMALRGDSIDNIPGAPGIGDKGSVEIIKRFGSVEAALEHAAEVEKKTYRESLLNNREAILLSKQLVTIDKNAPIEFELETMRMGEPDVESLRALFTELEFTSLLKEILPVVEVSDGQYVEEASAKDIAALLKERRSGEVLALAIDAGVATPAANEKEADADESPKETQGELLPLLAPSKPTCIDKHRCRIAISVNQGEAAAAALNGEVLQGLAAVLSDSAVPKAIHDYKRVMHVLPDVDIANVVHDPMLYSYLLDPTYSSHSLPEVALRRFNVKMSGGLAEAADITGRLTTALRKDVEEKALLSVYDEIDLPLVPVLARMEKAGVKIDTAALAQMSIDLESLAAAKATEIYELAGIEYNNNSPKQQVDVQFNRMSLPKPIKYGKGRTISTAVDVLEDLAEDHPVASKVLDYRQLTKLKSTYVDALPALINPSTGRVHTTFGQTSTSTGRLASTNPNLQNIPIRTELGREIRAAFIAEPGHVLLAADYSQIELRLLAHFSGDSLLVEAYKKGDDIHTLTASQVFGVPALMVTADHRRQAKVVNFGIVYGLSPFGLSQQLGIDTSSAKQFIQAYFEKYSGVQKFIDRTLEEARRDGRVHTLFGRIRPIPDINSKNATQRGFAERTAVNTPLQGTAADLIKLAMIRIDATLRQRKMRSRMTLQVHDELVFDVYEPELDAMKNLVREQMENVHQLKVPLRVDMGAGANWRDLD